MKTSQSITRLALMALLGLLPLSGCWLSYTNPTTLTLAVADTPVDGAQSVVVAFTGVELQGTSGTPLQYNYTAPVMVDLLQQQDDNFALLLNYQDIPAGHYRSLRLKVDISQSSITLADGSVHPLVIPPGGDRTGFTVTGAFSLASQDQLGLVVDFDLRKSITLVAGAYDFTPALRLVDANTSGELEGFMSTSFAIGGVAISNPACHPAAYVYAGTGVTPVDIDLGAPGQPVQTADVFLDPMSGMYHYGFEYMPVGRYTVALVCAGSDDPSKADGLTFSTPHNAVVKTQSATEVDF